MGLVKNSNFKKNVAISVVMVTYNHERYISQTIKAILDQQTDFDIELIIGDDASTDNAAEIIRNAVKDAQITIHLVLRSKNIGALENGADLLTRANGEFIALCDGDDYWSDNLKLQRQYDALRQNPNIDICFHPATKISGNKDVGVRNYYGKHGVVISAEHVIRGRGAFMPTASILVRRKALVPYLRTPIGDSYIQGLGSLRGGAIYLPEIMSVYREMTSGSISLANRKSIRSPQQIRSRYLNYGRAYGDMKALALKNVYEAVDEACQQSYFECLVDSLRAGDITLITEISQQINLQKLNSPIRAIVVRFARFRYMAPILTALIESKRWFQ